MDLSQFLVNSDDTGRFIVRSARTGKTYAVEPIYRKPPRWGSIDPATGKLVNKKGAGKYIGAVKEDESQLVEGDLFHTVVTLEAGVSPLHAIALRDAKYPTLDNPK